jgi:hypothetical protein
MWLVRATGILLATIAPTLHLLTLVGLFLTYNPMLFVSANGRMFPIIDVISC